MMWLMAVLLIGIGLWNLLAGVWIMAAVCGLLALASVYCAIEKMVKDSWY